MFAVPTAKKEVTFYKILIKSLETVLISASSPINAISKTERMEVLFGKHFLSFKSMQSTTVQNSVAISAIKKSSNIWQEPNFSTT